ncbi:MAG: hypothetical protein M1358_00815, partial [Chloroflexi bacterium]|nr:hypothetical protein [Chloroflexota bacterium]
FGAFPMPYLFGLALDRTGDYFYGFAAMSVVGLLGVYGAFAMRAEFSLEAAGEQRLTPEVSEAR